MLLGERQELRADATALVVSWGPREGRVAIHGEYIGGPNSSRYALRTEQDGVRGSYSWETRVLKLAGLNAANLGLRAETADPLAAGRRMLLPVTLGSGAPTFRPKAISLEVVSSVPLKTLSYTLGRRHIDGTFARLAFDRPVPGNAWGAYQRIVVPLPQVADGIHRVTLSGTTANDQPATLDLTFLVGDGKGQ